MLLTLPLFRTCWASDFLCTVYSECWIEGILTAVAYYDSEVSYFYLDFWIRNHSRFTHLLLPMRSTDHVSRSASWSGGSAFLIIHSSCV